MAVLGDELDDRLGRLIRCSPASCSARGMVWLTICIDPPPTSFLNLTSEKSGSMPVVSQSIMKPMVLWLTKPDATYVTFSGTDRSYVGCTPPSSFSATGSNR